MGHRPQMIPRHEKPPMYMQNHIPAIYGNLMVDSRKFDVIDHLLNEKMLNQTEDRKVGKIL